jgi:hypothetical protein
MGGACQVIANDLGASKIIAAQLVTLPECARFPPDVEDLCVQVRATVTNPDFPGALIPEALPTGGLQVIAIATPVDWRRLRPVLQAFAGPTLTSFKGLPVALSATTGIATVLREIGPAVTATILLPTEVQAQKSALRALFRIGETFARAPRLSRSAPEPTSWLLARFQDHLNIGRRDAAASLLVRLREELRLDALNLKALHVQLLATFDDWAGVANIPGFANLTVARRTPAVTALLLEALYQVHLASCFDGDERRTVEQVYAEKVRPLALPMLTVPAPSSLRAGGWRLFGLEALTSPGREELQTVLSARTHLLGWLAERCVPTVEKPSPTIAPLDQARELIVANEGSESIDALAAAFAALARLSDEQRLELSRAEPFSSAVRALEAETTKDDLPTSWVAWLARASDPTFTNALELSRFGSEEWSFADETRDPTDVRVFLDALGAAQADELAAQRTTQALPFVVAAVRRDPAFPSSAVTEVYASLLTLLALGAARGGAVYDSSQILIEALLVVGQGVRDYRALIADVEELAGEGFGVDMIFWALEVIEAFMRNSASDAGAREALVNRVLARIVPIRARLSSLQLAAVRRLAEEFGWALDGLELRTDQASQNDLAARLENKTVAIYSLSEGASRQAKVALQAAVPSVEVECNADHVGTPRLRALARNSDMFIIAWAAAKHSATEFIREHRGDRTLLYAQGKGFSSLLRAIEDHFKLVQQPLV